MKPFYRQNTSHLCSRLRINDRACSMMRGSLNMVSLSLFLIYLIGPASLQAAEVKFPQLSDLQKAQSKPQRLTDKLTLLLSRIDRDLPSKAVKSRITFGNTDSEALNLEIENLVTRANRIFGKIRSRDLNIHINIYEEIYASYFSPTKEELYVGVKTPDGHQKISSPVFIHELFHDVFLENFRLRYQNKNRTLLQLQTIVLRELADLDNTTKTQDQVEELMNAKYAFKLLGAYDELFADLASAIFHNDGALLAEVVKSYTKDTRLRNFTHIKKFRGWEPIDEVYTVFDPSRAAIWSLLQKNIHDEATPEIIMKTFLLAAQAHVEARMVKSSLEISLETNEKINQEFFRLFLEKGRTLNLWKSK